jgi:MFS family permease
MPLGLCLGMFMPLGLGRVAALTDHGEEYVAWAWAVNGFFSVVGSVLTTILSMALGFRLVQFAALLIYVVAAIAFTRLPTAVRDTVSLAEESPAQAVSV